MLKTSKKLNFYFSTPILIINHHFNLAEQKIWNLLLYLAHKHLLKKEFHEIPITKILELFKLNDSNFVHQKINNMATKQITDNPWLCHFKSLKIVDDKIVYQYPNELKILFSNKCTYEILQRLNNSTFESKYSLFFYELCLYLDLFKHINYIPNILLRRYLGITSKQYINPKYFLNTVLIKAIHEINIKTNLEIKLKAIKEGKQVAIFMLKIEKNPPFENLNKKDIYDCLILNFFITTSHLLLKENLKKINDNIIDLYISPKQKEFINNLIYDIDLTKNKTKIYPVLSKTKDNHTKWENHSKSKFMQNN